MRLFRYVNGYYYIAFSRGKNKSLRTKDKAIAERIFRKTKREILLGKIIDLTKHTNITLSEFTKEYIEHGEGINKSPSSIRSDSLALRTLQEHMGNKNLRSITIKVLDEFNSEILRSGKSIPTLNTYIRRLRAAFNKAVEWDYIEKNPYSKKDRRRILFKEEKRIPRYLDSKTEAPRLFEAITDPEFRQLVYLYILSGCRRAELVRLKWEHVKDDYFLVVSTKTKRERIVMLSDPMRELFGSMKHTHGYVFSRWRTPDTISRKFHKYVAAAKIPNIRLHDLRHTSASYLAMAGVSLDDIGSLLGHVDKRTTEIYTHFSPEYQKGLMDKLGNAFNLHLIDNDNIVSIDNKR